MRPAGGRSISGRRTGRHCAIFFNSGGAGCAAVPTDAPPGTNVVRIPVLSPAEYAAADPQVYTHSDAAVLPEGHKIEWDVSVCGVGFQGTVTCEVRGEHGFTIAATYGVLY